MSEIIENHLLDKRVKIYQSDDTYKASIDAVFLAASIKDAKAGQKLLDVGLGTGAVALCVAHRNPELEILGVEVQKELASLSQKSIEANNFSDRFDIVNADIADFEKKHPHGSFDYVVSNPPYYSDFSSSPNISRAKAHNMQSTPLSAWVNICLKMLKPKGYISIIIPPDKLDEIMALYNLKKVGDIKIYPLFSKPDNIDAKRLIVKARKSDKSPCKIYKGMIIHKEDGSYSVEADKILREAGAIEEL